MTEKPNSGGRKPDGTFAPGNSLGGNKAGAAMAAIVSIVPIVPHGVGPC